MVKSIGASLPTKGHNHVIAGEVETDQSTEGNKVQGPHAKSVYGIKIDVSCMC